MGTGKLYMKSSSLKKTVEYFSKQAASKIMMSWRALRSLGVNKKESEKLDLLDFLGLHCFVSNRWSQGAQKGYLESSGNCGIMQDLFQFVNTSVYRIVML